MALYLPLFQSGRCRTPHPAGIFFACLIFDCISRYIPAAPARPTSRQYRPRRQCSKAFGKVSSIPHELCPEVCAGCSPVGRPDFGEKPEHKEVRQVWEHIFSDLVTQRPSFTASLVRCFSFACVLICSVNFRSWPRIEGLSCSLSSTFALYFWKAAVIASA